MPALSSSPPHAISHPKHSSKHAASSSTASAAAASSSTTRPYACQQHTHPTNPLSHTSPFGTTKHHTPLSPRDPLSPTYHLPSYPINTDPPPRFVRSMLDVSDIERAQPFDVYSKRIGRVSNRVDDIQGAYRVTRAEHRRVGEYEEECCREEAEEKRVKAERKEKHRHSNPLEPEYQMGQHRSALSVSSLLQAISAGDRDKVSLHYNGSGGAGGGKENGTREDPLVIGPVAGSRTRPSLKPHLQMPPHSLRAFDPSPPSTPLSPRTAHSRTHCVSDIPGAQADTLHTIFKTHRCTNPLQPDYHLPHGTSGLDRLGERLNLQQAAAKAAATAAAQAAATAATASPYPQLDSTPSTNSPSVDSELSSTTPDPCSPTRSLSSTYGSLSLSKSLCRGPIFSSSRPSTASASSSSTSPYSSSPTSPPEPIVPPSSISFTIPITPTLSDASSSSPHLSSSSFSSSLSSSSSSPSISSYQLAASSIEFSTIPGYPLPFSAFYHTTLTSSPPPPLAPPQSFASPPSYPYNSLSAGPSQLLPNPVTLPIHPAKLSMSFGLSIPRWASRERAEVGGYQAPGTAPGQGGGSGWGQLGVSSRPVNERGAVMGKKKEVRAKIDSQRPVTAMSAEQVHRTTGGGGKTKLGGSAAVAVSRPSADSLQRKRDIAMVAMLGD